MLKTNCISALIININAYNLSATYLLVLRSGRKEEMLTFKLKLFISILKLSNNEIENYETLRTQDMTSLTAWQKPTVKTVTKFDNIN